MCGIAGIYKLDGSLVNERDLHVMTDIISYRGPDGFGYWYNDNKSLGLGHRRLSIIDLSDAGHQPMTYMGLTITFNGEIYNYLEIKNQLLAKGYQFKTESDTEVLLAAYHHKGKNCLNDLDGMFAFAIWDEKNNELFCARDRFGEKPFYYYYDHSKFIFGSEIKQMIAAGINKETNSETLYNYCTTNSLTHPSDIKQTFYKNIFLLPHSHHLSIKNNNPICVERYWNIDYKYQNNDVSFKNATQTFNELLYKSITRRLRSDVAIGTSLSGGLDSTTIASYICSVTPSKSYLNTFTASFVGFEKDETKFISIFKNRYPNIKDYYVSPTDEDLINDLDKFLFHHDEPLDSTSMYAQYKVMQLAKKNHVTVLLDGQGSDEFMGGYNQFWPVRLREMFAKRDKNYLNEKNVIKDLIGFEQNIGLNLSLMLRYPALHKSVSSIKNKFSGNSAAVIENPLQNDFYNPAVSVEKNHVNWSSLNAVLYHSVFSDGLQNLLRYADRNSMANSLEVRLPFLYHKLVEFVFSLPSHYKMNDGWSKFLLRNAQTNTLPEEICWRKEKVGYATPQSYWMQNKKIVELKNERKLALEQLHMFDKKYIDNIDNWKLLNLYALLK